MNWVKENGGVLVVGAVIFGLVLGYMELRAPKVVSAEMDQRGLVSDATLGEYRAELDAVKEAAEREREERIADRDRMDGKIERIVDILLEE